MLSRSLKICLSILGLILALSFVQSANASLACSKVQLAEDSDVNPILIESVELNDSTDNLPQNLQILRTQTSWSKLSAPARVAWNWIHSTFHNFRGVFAVVDLMALRKMPPRLISEDHPWATGISPLTGKSIWPDNIVFSSPRNLETQNGASDQQIVTTIGKFLSSMVKRSAPEDEIPQGPKRRMPHAVNYIHGTVHFNGVFMVFNNFRDAMFYFTDPAFVKEFKRVARQEQREITIVFRDREYKEYEYAFFMGFIRSHIPWYANGNGPKKKVFYGAMAGYPSVNTINGSWINDMYRLRSGHLAELVRPPVQKKTYFQSQYQGHRVDFSLTEKAFAHLNYLIVKARKAQGGMVFTPREKIEPQAVEEYKKTGRIDAGVDWEMPSFTEELRRELSE